jgi:imidazolonepropionase-like amidohydrolase
MNRSRTAAALMLLLPGLAAAPLPVNSSASARQEARPTLIRGVDVFDGIRMRRDIDVRIVEGRIAQVGPHLEIDDAAIVDGHGKTLLPGLIDSHTHTWPGSLQSALAFGVTTELDMFSDTTLGSQLRAEQNAGGASDRADIRSAGTLVTAPGGHGTEYGRRIPTLASAADARAFVAARVAEGSDYVKIVFDAGRTYGMTYPTLDREELRAVVAAAHEQHKLALVHIGDLAAASEAVRAGADGLAHLFVDQPGDASFVKEIVARRAFVIPTLTVLDAIAGGTAAKDLGGDDRLKPYLSPNDVAALGRGFPRRPGAPPVKLEYALTTVAALNRAGVPILAGTDAGNPGTSHGASLHGELELLVRAGLTPEQALAAATSVPARVFDLSDRGRIAAGLRADLVLVDGDPTRDITRSRAIAGIWKRGVRFDRSAVAKAVASARDIAERAPAGSESGLISDFESGKLDATFGTGWSLSTDGMANGKSQGQLRIVEGGAEGTAKALEISGSISPAMASPWAGAMFSPGAQMMAPVNLSGKKELRFWARGDGQPYRVMIFAESRGMAPQVQTFVAGPGWTEYAFPLSAFGGIDGRGLMAVLFVGGTGAGPFSFRIDQVRFR